MANKPDTLITLKKKVEEGIAIARAASDDHSLDAVIDEIETTFNHYLSGVYIMSAGIYGFKFRTERQIIEMLELYKKAIENGGHKKLFGETKGGLC